MPGYEFVRRDRNKNGGSIQKKKTEIKMPTVFPEHLFWNFTS